jgi:hypothetical protein
MDDDFDEEFLYGGGGAPANQAAPCVPLLLPGLVSTRLACPHNRWLTLMFFDARSAPRRVTPSRLQLQS